MAEPNNLDNKLVEIEKSINEYTNAFGIFNQELSLEEIKQYLAMDRKSLRSLSEEDCGEISWVLGQTALSIQKEINKQTAITKWLEAQINKTIAKQLNNYKAYSYEERKLCAINDNEYTTKASQLKVRAEMRISSLQYMSQEIKNLSSSILSIKDTKRRYKENA